MTEFTMKPYGLVTTKPLVGSHFDALAGGVRRSRNAWLDRRSGPACSQLASSSGILSPRQRAALHCSGTTIMCKDPERVVGTGRRVPASTLGTEAGTHMFCTVRSVAEHYEEFGRGVPLINLHGGPAEHGQMVSALWKRSGRFLISSSCVLRRSWGWSVLKRCPAFSRLTMNSSRRSTQALDSPTFLRSPSRSQDPF
jgi:hypothetical protein